MVTLDALPQEIQVEIMAQLDYRSILRCALACRALQETWKTSLELQCIVELAMDGMEESGSKVPHVELLARLRDLRASWEELEWKRYRQVLVERDCRAYELVAGVFAISDGHGLDVIWLPSASVDRRNLEREPLGFFARDIAIDPTQDLIAILEEDHTQMSFTQGRHVRVYLCAISTHESHPLAADSILTFDIAPDEEHGNTVSAPMLQIAYDIFALFFTNGGMPFKSRVLIWNWREGTLLYDSESMGESLPRDIHSFSLLSRDSFILTSTRFNGALHLYSFSPSINSTGLAPPILAATLHLPRIHPTYDVWKLSIYPAPFHAHAPPNTLFSTSQADSRIDVLYVAYLSHDEESIGPGVVNYTLFVHNRTFLGYINDHASMPRGGPGSPQLNVNWDSWGEMKTRFVPSLTRTHWLRYVHGQRVAFTNSDIFIVYDFNVSKDTAPSPTSGKPSPRSQRRLQSEPSCEYPAYLFVDNIVTRLPYHVTTRAMGEYFSACMIDDERIIGLKMGICMELHVYSL